MWKDSAVVYFKVLSINLSVSAEENLEIFGQDNRSPVQDPIIMSLPFIALKTQFWIVCVTVIESLNKCYIFSNGGGKAV
jgi:hypothetical protein